VEEGGALIPPSIVMRGPFSRVFSNLPLQQWWQRGLAVLFFGMTSLSSHAVIQISGLDDISLGSWTGSGGLIGSDTYCVISTRGSGSQRVSYNVGAYGPHYSNGYFYLQRVGSSSRLPISFKWTGNRGGTYTMRDYPSTNFYTGNQYGARSCSEANSVARIDIEVSASALGSAQAGIYRGNFQIDAYQAGTPYHTTIRSFVVEIPELVQITQLDDIDLGHYDGANDKVAEESICIFRNGGGDYRLRASGGNGSNDPFILNNGVNTLPYEVAVREGSQPFVQRNPGQSLNNLSGSRYKNCNGSTNADVRITVRNTAMQAATPGSYNGVLYLTAEPQ
jgi:hypothetical protein